MDDHDHLEAMITIVSNAQDAGEASCAFADPKMASLILLKMLMVSFR